MLTATEGELTERVRRLIGRLESGGDARFDLASHAHFAALLEELGAPRDGSVAVRAALATVAVLGEPGAGQPGRLGAPPEALVGWLVAQVNGLEVGRIPEVVLAALLGWNRCPGPPCDRGHEARAGIDPRREDWQGRPRGAVVVLRRFVLGQVASCLDQLQQANRRGGVPGFSSQPDSSFWAQLVIDRFLDHQASCRCWSKLTKEADPERLRGNVLAKATNCLEHHHLDVWCPTGRGGPGGTQTLWYFVERAVKGFVGRFKHEGFPSGMLHDVLWQEGERFVRANVVRRPCWSCGETVKFACGHGRYDPESDGLTKRNWLIRVTEQGEPDGGFIEGAFWECPAGHFYPEGHDCCPVRTCAAFGLPRKKKARRHTCYHMS